MVRRLKQVDIVRSCIVAITVILSLASCALFTSHSLIFKAVWDYEPGFCLDIEGDIMYMTNGQNAINVFNLANPNYPNCIRRFTYPDSTGSICDMCIQDSILFLANRTSIVAIDFTNPNYPLKLSHYKTPGTALSIFCKQDSVFVADSTGIALFKLRDRDSLFLIAADTSIEMAELITYENGNIYVLSRSNGLQICHMQDGKIATVGQLGDDIEYETVLSMTVAEDCIFLSYDNTGMISIIDVSEKTAPQLKATVNTGLDEVASIRILSDELFASGKNGIAVFSISNICEPEPILKGTLQDHYLVETVVYGNYLYTSDCNVGMHVIIRE